jgi:hypothetical protein
MVHLVRLPGIIDLPALLAVLCKFSCFLLLFCLEAAPFVAVKLQLIFPHFSEGLQEPTAAIKEGALAEQIRNVHEQRMIINAQCDLWELSQHDVVVLGIGCTRLSTRISARYCVWSDFFERASLSIFLMAFTTAMYASHCG